MLTIDSNWLKLANPLEQFADVLAYHPDLTEKRCAILNRDVHHTTFYGDLYSILKWHFNVIFEGAVYHVSSLTFADVFFVLIFAIGFFFVMGNNETNSETEMDLLRFVSETSESLVKNIVQNNTNLEKQEHFSTFWILFLTIITANLLGLIPFSYCITSSFAFTFFLAGTHFLGLNINGIYKHGWNFFGLFLPAGVPLFIAPFLVVIELVSYIAKVFSLSIRLFANMMSGHALLKILIGFSWTLLANGGLLIFISIVPWALVTVIFFLELLIAFLQAYVFTILLAIYLNDIFVSH